jgi:hypothetical protein
MIWFCQPYVTAGRADRQNVRAQIGVTGMCLGEAGYGLASAVSF